MLGPQSEYLYKPQMLRIDDLLDLQVLYDCLLETLNQNQFIYLIYRFATSMFAHA